MNGLERDRIKGTKDKGTEVLPPKVVPTGLHCQNCIFETGALRSWASGKMSFSAIKDSRAMLAPNGSGTQ
jgi:hypothetical protein